MLGIQLIIMFAFGHVFQSYEIISASF